MRAVCIEKLGSPEVLKVCEFPRPTPKANEVLVRVRASSVNPRDTLIRSGRYQLQFLLPKRPLVLGSDIAGVIEAVGERVRGFKIGDQVMAMKNPTEGHGGYAEYVTVRATSLAPKPSERSFNEAAGLPLCGLTALQALRKPGRLRSGEDVLVIGASGGVGSFAVQIARQIGANVTGVCSGRNADLVRSLGCVAVVDYTQESILDRPERYDIVFNTIGSYDPILASRILKSGGRFLTTIPNARALWQAAWSRFAPWGAVVGVAQVKPSGRDLSELSGWMAQGKLRTVIDSVYPLAQLADAHRRSQTRRARGKIIISTGEKT